MSTIVITPSTSSLPTCNPNLMPFHIGHTGSAAVSMFLRVEKMKAEEAAKEEEVAMVVLADEESKVKERAVKEGEEDVQEPIIDCIPLASITGDENNDSNNIKDEDVEMNPDLLNSVQLQGSQITDIEMSTVLPTQNPPLVSIPSTSSSSQTLSDPVQASASTSTLVSSDSLNLSSTLVSSSILSSFSNLKDIDKRFISSFRGRTIHGLTVDLPAGYTGLLLQADDNPQSTITRADRMTRVLNAKVKSVIEGEDEHEEGTKGGRRTRSKSKAVDGNGKGKAKDKQKETKKTAPRGRLVRTAAPKRAVEPEVIVIDREDQEVADHPAPTESVIEVLDCPLELTKDDMNVPDDSVDNDLEGVLDKGMPLRKLVPQSTFSSITLWHADRAVDETRDEYYRTLTEWMALSHEVSTPCNDSAC